MLWPVSGLPPKSSFAPGTDSSRSACPSMRSVVSVFAGNLPHFHAEGGAAYAWLGDVVEKVDKINPQVAARLAGAFALHKRYDAARGALMRAQLERIRDMPGVSKDTYEVCARSLA